MWKPSILQLYIFRNLSRSTLATLENSLSIAALEANALDSRRGCTGTSGMSRAQGPIIFAIITKNIVTVAYTFPVIDR